MSLAIAQQAVSSWGAHQKPHELTALLELVGPTSIVVEVGCDQGGTLWALRQTGAHVIGVTLQHGWFGTGKPLDSHGCPVILGDSHDVRTMERLRAHLAGRSIDLLFIDADHRYGAVLEDFNTFAPLVRSGGVVALHDICHHDPITVGGDKITIGVEQLWRELVDHFPDTREVIVPPTDWGGIGFVTIE